MRFVRICNCTQPGPRRGTAGLPSAEASRRSLLHLSVDVRRGQRRDRVCAVGGGAVVASRPAAEADRPPAVADGRRWRPPTPRGTRPFRAVGRPSWRPERGPGSLGPPVTHSRLRTTACWRGFAAPMPVPSASRCPKPRSCPRRRRTSGPTRSPTGCRRCRVGAARRGTSCSTHPGTTRRCPKPPCSPSVCRRAIRSLRRAPRSAIDLNTMALDAARNTRPVRGTRRQPVLHARGRFMPAMRQVWAT
jgi:hypothetical protein